MTASRWLLVAAVPALTTLTACGGETRLSCADSIHARATGAYANLDARAATRANRAHARSCNLACGHDHDPASCVEMELLDFDVLHDLIRGRSLVPYCEAGQQPACDWVEQHKAELARWAQYDAEHPQPQRSGPETTAGPVEDSLAISQFAVQLEEAGAARGFSTVADDNYTLAGGYTAVAVPAMVSGVDYVVTIIARSSNPFTAQLRGFGLDPKPIPAAQSPAGLVVRSLAFQVNDDPIDQPQIVITADGGDQSSVRVIQSQHRQ